MGRNGSSEAKAKARESKVIDAEDDRDGSSDAKRRRT